MRRDSRPYFIKRLQHAIESKWIDHFIAPQLESMGAHPLIMKPWNLNIHGAGIGFGDGVHVITSRDRPVSLTTWALNDTSGTIHVGNNALLCPGVRVDAALEVQIGAGSMLAANAYVTDADWHDIYDRAAPIGNAAAVKLAENTWIGDSAIVCKGVTIGANSVIGAGSVVTKDVPANVIAAGNPASVVKPLDPSREVRTRVDALGDVAKVASETKALERYLLSNNSLLNWLRTLVAPNRQD